MTVEDYIAKGEHYLGLAIKNTQDIISDAQTEITKMQIALAMIHRGEAEGKPMEISPELQQTMNTMWTPDNV